MNYSYDYSYTTHTPSSDTAVVAALIGFFFFLLIFALFSYAITSWLLGRIFRKAGVEQWMAWIPIYNTWKLLELGGQQGFWAVLSLIPFANLISMIFIYIAMHNVGKKFGKDDWFILVGIFIPLVWLIWLAYDSSTWPAEKPTTKGTATKKAPAIAHTSKKSDKKAS